MFVIGIAKKILIAIQAGGEQVSAFFNMCQALLLGQWAVPGELFIILYVADTVSILGRGD